MEERRGGRAKNANGRWCFGKNNSCMTLLPRVTYSAAAAVLPGPNIHREVAEKLSFQIILATKCIVSSKLGDDVETHRSTGSDY